MTSPTPAIARPSVASLPLQPRFQGTELGVATGFVLERQNRKYLITNWHVVTGRRPDTGLPLSATAAVPDRVAIMHHRRGALGTWLWKVELLYGGDGQPRWLEHPLHGRRVDVVALELTDVSDVDVYPHDPWNTGPDLLLGITTDVSIIGFPFGISGGGGLGVWVRGAVATEPALDFDGLPCFLVDSRTRPGQSGSPVILYVTGGAVATADGGTAFFGGPVEQFLGVYSGRLNEESDLGFVWKAAALKEIVEGNHKGSV